MTIRARTAGAGFLVAALLLIGCGESGNPHVPAKLSGKVTYNGTPVGGGVVTLHAADGQMYTATLATDGTFTFPNLPEGELTATVETESVNPNRKQVEYRGGSKFGPAPRGGGGGGGAVAKGKGMKGPAPPPEGANIVEPVYVKIPAKYADKAKSGLKVTLKKGDQAHNFELTD